MEERKQIGFVPNKTLNFYCSRMVVASIFSFLPLLVGIVYFLM